MKRFVRTTLGIYDTTHVRKESEWDCYRNVMGYFDCNKTLISLHSVYCDIIAKVHGIILKEADTVDELIVKDDLVKDNYLYIKNNLTYKAVAYFRGNEWVVFSDEQED